MFENYTFVTTSHISPGQKVAKLKCLLTHWGRVTHICVSRQTITGSDNGLSLGRRQAIIWTYAGILLIGPLGTNFSENLIKILTFPLTKIRLKLAAILSRPQCVSRNLSPITASNQWCLCQCCVYLVRSDITELNWIEIGFLLFSFWIICQPATQTNRLA